MFTFARDVARWLRAERTVPECPPRQRATAKKYLDAARMRLAPARDVWSAPRPVVAAALLRDAAILLRLAVAAARGEAPPATTGASMPASIPAPEGPDGAARWVTAAVSSPDPLYFDALDDADLDASIRALKDEVQRLQTQIDFRSDAYWRGTRIGRQASLVIVALWLGYLAVAGLFAQPDLALGKTVRASSHQVGTPDPSGLVDGKIAETYGFHTSTSARDPWAIIDLGRDMDLRRVVVYNRSDTNLNDGLPFAVDVSNDGSTFREVAHRDAPFGDGSFLAPPWTASIRDHARYVRIRATHYMALNEVEVF
jgi:hypothetical protein